MTIISTQRYIDADTVSAKQRGADYDVQIVRVVIDDVEYGYVMDGHHSLAASVADGVQAEIDDVTDEYAYEIEYLGADGFIAAHHMGDDIYDVATGNDLF